MTREPILGIRRVHDRDSGVFIRPDEPVTIYGFADQEVFQCSVLRGFDYEETILATREWVEQHPRAADAERNKSNLINRGVQ